MHATTNNEGIRVLTDANFCSEVLCYPGLILVHFFVEWSGASLLMNSILAQLAIEYRGRIRIGQLDIEANSVTRSRYGIHEPPTLLLFQGGHPEAGFSGAVSHGRLATQIESLLDDNASQSIDGAQRNKPGKLFQRTTASLRAFVTRLWPVVHHSAKRPTTSG